MSENKFKVGSRVYYGFGSRVAGTVTAVEVRYTVEWDDVDYAVYKPAVGYADADLIDAEVVK